MQVNRMNSIGFSSKTLSIEERIEALGKRYIDKLDQGTRQIVENAADKLPGIYPRIEAVQRNGLPLNTSWKNITKVGSEKARTEAAQRYGLRRTATWDDIIRVGSEKARTEAAQRYGLPVNATWTDISKVNNKKPLDIKG